MSCFCIQFKMKTIIFVMTLAVAATDPASDQLCSFKKKTQGPIGIMTYSNGAPVDVNATNTLNSPLIRNEFFMETMTHLVRERIPHRTIHAKGTGAFGYFEVTYNVTDICKAKLFSEIGKQTPVVVRFSLAIKDKGEPDTSRDVKGFAIKFYTEDGNFDLAGFNTPMYFYKDPIIFSSMAKALSRNPATNLHDAKMVWDILTLDPHAMFFFMYLFRDFGTNDGYRHIPGYSIHTYQFYNCHGESYYARFHLLPDAGIKNLFADEAAKIGGLDPDYATRDLYNAIENGNFPSWSVSLQVLTTEDVNNAKFDVFDMTRILPLDTYPLRPLGKLVLNINPTNVFSDIEQIAYCPGNVVPGILGGPDRIFESRRHSYRDSHLYRLGANFNKILVNSPLRTVFSYDRDGKAPVGDNGGDSPNYYPNSYHGPVPYYDPKRPKLLRVTHDNSYSFDQAAEMYNEMTKDERSRMIENIVASLSQADQNVQQRAIGIFTEIHPDLGLKIAAALARKNKSEL